MHFKQRLVAIVKAMTQEARLESLDELILKIVREAPNHRIRPSRVASQLALSHADATEQLCGLLRAVGRSATFQFEEIKGDDSRKNMVMTFQFPPDFEQRAKRNKRVTKLRDTCYQILILILKILKIAIALGFILSLVVVTFLSIVVLVGAFIAMLTQGRNEHHPTRQLLVSPHRIRSMILALRDVLWIYAVFGDFCGCCEYCFGRRQEDEYGRPHQDPFFREIAQDISLLLSCLGSNGGFGFYWGAHMLQQRRLFAATERNRRGWGGFGRRRDPNEGVSTPIPGVYVLNRGDSWRRGEQEDEDQQDRRLLSHTGILQQQEVVRKGFVSVAIEFLFGPIPFWPGPSELQKWKLREWFIVTHLSKQSVGGIHMERFLPYCDYPPSVAKYSDPLDFSARHDQKLRYAIVSQCLPIISYFAGLPADRQLRNSSEDQVLHDTFIFPELMLEAEGGGLSLDVSDWATEGQEHWTSFLYDENKKGSVSALPLSFSGKSVNSPIRDAPTFMREGYHTLTRLCSSQFYVCLCLGVFNLVGIIGLQNYLQTTTRSFLQAVFIRRFLFIFYFYAWAFLAAPLVRAVFILFLNKGIARRNQKRKQWVEKLDSQ